METFYFSRHLIITFFFGRGGSPAGLLHFALKLFWLINTVLFISFLIATYINNLMFSFAAQSKLFLDEFYFYIDLTLFLVCRYSILNDGFIMHTAFKVAYI